jgi:mono/diheme cytochrome c family protein
MAIGKSFSATICFQYQHMGGDRMANHCRRKSFFAVLILLLTTSMTVGADEGKALFAKECADCHSIGGGDSGGPDLQGVVEKRQADWLLRVIVEPDKLSAEKDPLQAELVEKSGYEMPNVGISADDARKIIAYLAVAGGAGATTSAPVAAQAETMVTPELIAQGKALLTGRTKLANGGAPCLSCHPFTYPGLFGGNLSTADLSASYQRMGDTGMKGALKALKFPTMKKIYADRPLTDAEVAALMAIFKDSVAQKGKSSSFFVAGGALFVLLILGLAFYKRRIG